jgi:hypothetical protein
MPRSVSRLYAVEKQITTSSRITANVPERSGPAVAKYMGALGKPLHPVPLGRSTTSPSRENAAAK